MEEPLNVTLLLREQIRLLMEKSKDCKAEEIRENIRILIELYNAGLVTYL